MNKLNRRTLMQASAAGLTASMLASVATGRFAAAQETGYNGEEVTLTYGLWDAGQLPGVENQIAVFNEQFPAIKIEPQVVPFVDYWPKLQTGIAGGSTNDVFWINTANFPVFATQGALLTIDSIIGEGGAEPDRYPQPLVESFQYEGAQYGIPRDFDTIALFYNTELFDAAGVEYPTGDWTWDDLRAAAEQLNQEGGPWGFGAILSGQQNYYNFIWQNEGKLINDDLTESLINEPPAAEAIDFLSGFFEDGLTPAVSIMQANDPEDTLFPAGQIAMMPGGSWHVGVYKEANPAIRVAPLPQGKTRACMIHGLANVIWANTPNKEAALEWVKFLASEEAERILGQTATVLPAMEGLQEEWVAATPEMDLQIFLDAIDYSVARPSPPTGPEWENEIERVLIEGWGGNIPRDEIANQAAEAANAALSRE